MVKPDEIQGAIAATTGFVMKHRYSAIPVAGAFPCAYALCLKAMTVIAQVKRSCSTSGCIISTKVTSSVTAKRKTMVDPDSATASYDYDDAGKLIKLTNAASGATTISYDTAGREIVNELANGTANQFGYDAAGRMIHSRAASDATTLRQYDYATDRIGNRTSVADADGNASNWSYDHLGQLSVDYYLPLSELSWMTLTLEQWNRLTLAQWDTLPLNPTTLDSGSLELSYDPAGNRLNTVDPLTQDITTYTCSRPNYGRSSGRIMTVWFFNSFEGLVAELL